MLEPVAVRMGLPEILRKQSVVPKSSDARVPAKVVPLDEPTDNAPHFVCRHSSRHSRTRTLPRRTRYPTRRRAIDQRATTLCRADCAFGCR